MGACREAANLWQHIRWFLGRDKYMCYRLFSKRLWTSPDFWHDSFGQYINRFIICPLFGHGKVIVIEDDCGKFVRRHCFKCERDVEQ